MKFCDFEYAAPATLKEAVSLLAAGQGEAKIIAGGQSLLPTMAYRLAQPSMLVDLRKIPGLSGIRIDNDGVEIGALTRWRDIENDARLSTAQPLLREAIRHVAHYQIRNMGTVGGSLAHADPAAEMPGIAMTCDARIRVQGDRGERIIPAADFFLGPLSTALSDDEIIVDIQLPAWAPERYWAFKEFSKRQGDFAIAGVALHFLMDAGGRAADVHVGAIGTGDRPLRLAAVEQYLTGKVLDESAIKEAGRLASEAVQPGDDIHASAAYRRSLAGTLTRRCLNEALHRASPAAAGGQVRGN